MKKKVIKSFWDLELPSEVKAVNDVVGKLRDPNPKDPIITGGAKPTASISAQSAHPSQKPLNQIQSPTVQRIVGAEDRNAHIAKETKRLEELARTLELRESKLALDQAKIARERENLNTEKLALQNRTNQVIANQRESSDKEKANYRRAAELDLREASIFAAELECLDRRAEMKQKELELEKLMAEVLRPGAELKELQTELARTQNELERKCDEVSKLLKTKEAYQLLKNNELVLKLKKSWGASSAEEEKHAESQRKIKELVASPFTINSMKVLEWLSSSVLEEFQPPDQVLTLGSGPFAKKDFDDYLNTLEVNPCESVCDWIILGRTGWTHQQIDDLIETANLNEVRIFSQELFIAGVLTTHDPYSAGTKLLMEFAKGHPALEYLIGSGFEWPILQELDELGVPHNVRGSYEGVDESPIYRMGYVVGITNGLEVSERQKLLRKAFEEAIPEVGGDDYMAEWGTPITRVRLWRIAHHLAWLVRSRRRNPVMGYAVNDWENDLDWLKNKFYKSWMKFSWPNVQ